MIQFNSNHSSSVLSITENSPAIFEPGQRRCGPPANWKGPPPGKGCEIFIAKIPKDCYEKELIPIFREIGDIYTFRLMMENENCHRGFGFCVYTAHETAKEAVLRLNNYQIKKYWYLGVCFSVDNCRLFVGGIPKLKTKMEIYDEMSAVTENVVDIIVYPSAADKSKNRGFAFVEYTNHKAAAIARKKMISNGIQLWGHNVAVDWAEPERKVEDEVMQKVKILYVRNLMLTTTEDTIYRVFSKYVDDKEEIVKVKKIDDFAFIHFKSRDQAEIVKNKTHGMNLEGTTIEVHFAKPVNKIEQQQKLLKKSQATFGQGIPMLFNNDFSRISIGSNDNKTASPESSDKNGLNNNRSYRNAAGRCSIKSRHMIKKLENNELISTNVTALLSQVCQKHKLGVPLYPIMPMIFPSSENNIQLFVGQVYIPGLNAHFSSIYPSFTHEEAIISASETALIYLFYNGFQVPLFINNLEKSDATTKFENISRTPFDKNVASSVQSICINNGNVLQPNPSQFYMSQIFKYNALPYLNNNTFVSPNNFFETFDVNDLKGDNIDQNRINVQTFQKN